MSSANKNSFMSSFPTDISFFPLSYVIALVRIVIDFDFGYYLSSQVIGFTVIYDS